METIHTNISESFTTQSILIPNSKSNEFSLKQNYFDPSKFSPPDNFIEKLEIRMQRYYNSLNKDARRDTTYFTK